jgi:erythromycin esterase-like protein
MSGSIAALLEYLDKVDPQAAEVACERYGTPCATAWSSHPGPACRSPIRSGCKR